MNPRHPAGANLGFKIKVDGFSLGCTVSGLQAEDLELN